jgi:two-component system, NtrC family, response regulator HydG
MQRILVTDDDVTFTLILKKFLERNGYTIEVSHNVQDAVEKATKTKIDLYLLDYHLPDGNGLDIVSKLKQNALSAPVIMMTSYNEVRLAVKAIKMGVFDYITKPVNQEELLMLINEALSTEKAIPVPEKKDSSILHPLVHGKSEGWQLLHGQVKLLAPTEMSAIIIGESGTGKENIARMIHAYSNRASGPFMAIDCGTLSKDLAGSELFGHIKGAFTGALDNKKGSFEHAGGGTVFLDEIGNLPTDVQVKLLRVLQERVVQPVGSNKFLPIDVRIIAATNDDLWKSTRDGRFREDLYHRLNEFTLRVPPLRERGEDLLLFAGFFRQEANQTLHRNVQRFSPEVIDFFEHYHWPGNIRELKNIVKRMVLLCRGEEAGLELMPEEMILQNKEPAAKTAGDLKALKEISEKEMILQVLNEVQFNKTKAARKLNIDRSTLYAKMEKYGI